MLHLKGTSKITGLEIVKTIKIVLKTFGIVSIVFRIGDFYLYMTACSDGFFFSAFFLCWLARRKATKGYNSLSVVLF